ncbi:hypothetical protein M758_8G022700 [Ceratodon purpureus]|nr:hypothetical protein M758_8G022700 [Ceratodon purpureus]
MPKHFKQVLAPTSIQLHPCLFQPSSERSLRRCARAMIQPRNLEAEEPRLNPRASLKTRPLHTLGPQILGLQSENHQHVVKWAPASRTRISLSTISTKSKWASHRILALAT